MYGTIAITVVPPKLIHKMYPLELPLTQVYGKDYCIFHPFGSKATQKIRSAVFHQPTALCKNCNNLPLFPSLYIICIYL